MFKKILSRNVILKWDFNCETNPVRIFMLPVN
jgi:hypothetical protein